MQRVVRPADPVEAGQTAQEAVMCRAAVARALLAVVGDIAVPARGRQVAVGLPAWEAGVWVVAAVVAAADEMAGASDRGENK